MYNQCRSCKNTETSFCVLTLLFFVQHYLTMVGGTLSTPFILSGPMCFANNTLVISEVLSTIFFASGLVTLLQSTF